MSRAEKVLSGRWTTLARKRWPLAVSIGVGGPIAVVAPDGNGLTVSLHATWESAMEAKRLIDEMGCGGGCEESAHVIVDLRTEAEKAMVVYRRHLNKTMEGSEA